MTFNATSFLAGVGTMFAAVALGFAGGAMITTSPKVEQNRVERVAAAAAPVATARTDATAPPAVTPAKAEETEPTPVPDRVIAMTPAATAQPTPTPGAQPPAPPRPVMARDDTPSQMDSGKKAREGEMRKEAELKRAERRAERRERRRRQNIEAAANAVRQIQRDGDMQQVSQRDDTPRFGFFGND